MSALDTVRRRLESREWPTLSEYTALLVEIGTEPSEVLAQGSQYARSRPAERQTGEQKLLAALRGVSLPH